MNEAGLLAEGLGKDYPTAARWGELLRLRLRRARVTALDGVSLRIERGEAVALLGVNGAGKSTLLKCFAGLLTPSRGRAEVAGCDVAGAGAELRRRVGYVTGDGRSFSWRISGRANLMFFAALYGLRARAAAARVDEVLALVGLGAADAARVVAEYSTGMRQRLALARGFLAEPEVLLLDEPTAGVDLRGAGELRRYLRDEMHGRRGCTLLVATHTLDDARALASRAIVLAAGRVVHDGDLDAAARKLVDE